MRAPSVKGELLGPVVEELLERLDGATLGRERLEVALEPRDLTLLEEKIRPHRWYPMQSYGRIVELLAEASGTGRTEAFLERGARAARALLAAEGESVDALRERLGEDPDALASWVAATVLRNAARQQSCGRWTWLAGDAGSGGYELEVREAEPLPECLRVLTEVALRRLHAELGPRGRTVASERVSSDRIVFRVQ